MPEFPNWRHAWLAELIRRVDETPSLLDSCPRPVAQCLAEIVKPTGELPERLEHDFGLYAEQPSRTRAELPVCHECGCRHLPLCPVKVIRTARLGDAYRRATCP